MNREFLELYDRELKILYERSKEFAEDFPGVAARLGALAEDRVDPAIGGLLEGAAFLAARVQLKMKSEFDTFTSELLKNLMPGLLSPVPSFVIVNVQPDYSNPDLLEGVTLAAGSYVETSFIENERRASCTYRLTSPVTVWPYQIRNAEFFSSVAALQARGIDTLPSVVGGLCLEFALRVPGTNGNAGVSVRECTPDEFVVYLNAPFSDAASLYELLFSKLARITIRHGKDGEAPRIHRLPAKAITAVGFNPKESLFPFDQRNFTGFNYLREYFAFPQRFLGFTIKGLREILKQVEADFFQIYFELEGSSDRLASVIGPNWFALYASPAANLMELTCTPVSIRDQDHEYVVTVDRSRPLDYEVHSILSVSARFTRSKESTPVYPLYSAPPAHIPIDKAYFYTSRQLERRKTDVERRAGLISNYLGTDTFISLREPVLDEGQPPARSLVVRALATNRHMTDRLPVRRGKADFLWVNDSRIALECIAGPTPPREAIVTNALRSEGQEANGALLWKLISLLQFNHLGISGDDASQSAAAVRDLMMIFASISNPDIEKRIRGIVGISTKPVVRKIRQSNGYNPARGLQIAIEFDETAYEGSGAFLLGAVLSRFLSEYSSINSFVEVSAHSRQRGHIMRWDPVTGAKDLL